MPLFVKSFVLSNGILRTFEKLSVKNCEQPGYLCCVSDLDPTDLHYFDGSALKANGSGRKFGSWQKYNISNRKFKYISSYDSMKFPSSRRSSPPLQREKFVKFIFNIFLLGVFCFFWIWIHRSYWNPDPTPGSRSNTLTRSLTIIPNVTQTRVRMIGKQMLSMKSCLTIQRPCLSPRPNFSALSPNSRYVIQR
jgi:hypothetical protein